MNNLSKALLQLMESDMTDSQIIAAIKKRGGKQIEAYLNRAESDDKKSEERWGPGKHSSIAIIAKDIRNRMAKGATFEKAVEQYVFNHNANAGTSRFD